VRNSKFTIDEKKMTSLEYQEALDYIYSFVDYSVERSYRYSAEVFDLDRVRELLERLGNPHTKYPSFHIAGTKGKGSVAAYVSSCLQAGGYKTGLYTSPHLQRFSERIQVDHKEIEENSFVEIVRQLRVQVPKVKGLTTYELITALGFLHFALKGVDVAVIEVGLGGRLDATNVIEPLVSVITPISYDHMHLLGDSLSDIAREKAGIIKPGVSVVSAPQQYEVEVVLNEIARENSAPMILVGRDWLFSPGRHSLEGQSLYIWSREEQPMMDIFVDSAGKEEWVPPRYEISLLGYHQVVNATTAYAALNVVSDGEITLSNQHIAKGFQNARWPGRFQVLSLNPVIVVDSAHNRDSALKLRLAMDDYFPGQDVTLIFGASEDKDIPGMLVELMPRVSKVIVTQAKHPRAASLDNLSRQARAYGSPVETISPVSSALEHAANHVDEDEVILAAGSLFVAGEVITAWQNIRQDLKNKNKVGD
jgi:dihydrofolate synthase/folylpolyglutamate synthase